MKPQVTPPSHRHARRPSNWTARARAAGGMAVAVSGVLWLNTTDAAVAYAAGAPYAQGSELHPAQRSALTPLEVATNSVVVPPDAVPAQQVAPLNLAPAPTAASPGIPAIALQAYQKAAQAMVGAAPACKLPWTVLAAIGYVESDHGQFNGSHLDAKGTATPNIIGPVLDGTNGTRAVPASDAGDLTGDPTWEHAVGPMQFLPSTWRVIRVDGDGDGDRNPENIFDAALGTAVYLCAGGADMSAPASEQAAIRRYNNSDPYVAAVLSIADSYAKNQPIPVASVGQLTAAAVAAATPPGAAPPAPAVAPAPAPVPVPASSVAPPPVAPASSTPPAAAPSPACVPAPSASASPSADPSGSPTAGPSPSATPSASPAPSPSADASPSGSPSASPSDSPSPPVCS